MIGIEKDLPKHKCKTCKNLNYWDWYFCNLEKHKDEKDFLSREELQECDGYEQRYGRKGDSCETQECIFWCLDCTHYKVNNDVN
jgi:hypothetical protein